MELQNCHITQYERNGEKTDWFIINGDRTIGKIPKVLNEKEAMNIIRFARLYELKAFEKGKETVVKFKNKEIENLKLNYETIIDNLKKENEKLSLIVENLTQGDE